MSEENQPVEGELVPTSGGFYYRRDETTPPVIRGHDIRFEKRCKGCSLVANLQGLGHSYEEAMNAEKIFYRMIYTFCDAMEISDWLSESYDYEIAHDSISRHIKRHIPDPNVVFLERVRRYRPQYMQERFVDVLLETMRLTMMQYQSDLVHGAVEIKPSDFVKVAQVYKEWQQDKSEGMESQFMSALKETLNEVLDDDQMGEFEKTFREKLENIENE